MKSFNKNSKKYNYAELSPIEIYELVRSGNIKTFPNNFWECDESDVYEPQITRYLIENILNWTDDDIKEQLCKLTFKVNHIGGLICSKHIDIPIVAIIAAYPKVNLISYLQCSFLNNIYLANLLIKEKMKQLILQKTMKNFYNHILKFLVNVYICQF